jgi:hypothetical protein
VEKAHEVKQSVVGNADNLRERYHDVKEDLKEKGGEMKGRASEKMHHVKQDLKEKGDEIYESESLKKLEMFVIFRSQRKN